MSATTQQFESLVSPNMTSPLILSDRLLTLAEAAERAGFAHTADDLVRLAHKVFDEKRREDA